jgi:hypothetical protein
MNPDRFRPTDAQRVASTPDKKQRRLGLLSVCALDFGNFALRDHFICRWPIMNSTVRVFDWVNVVSSASILAAVGAAFAAILYQLWVQLRAWKSGGARQIEIELGHHRRVIPDQTAQAGAQQFALLREYHSQGLAQSRISFWFSLVFAAIGFFVIVLSVGLFITQGQQPDPTTSLHKPTFALVAGTIIDAVAALFFVQSNRARQLMTEFFDKLRIDRKLDEALRLANEIIDQKVQASLKAVLALSFADVKSAEGTLAAVLGPRPPSAPVPEVSPADNVETLPVAEKTKPLPSATA